MGSFWTNILLRTEDESAMRAGVKSTGLAPCYSSSAAKGWIVLYPNATEVQDPEILDAALVDLTRELRCAGLATLMHDGDTFLYVLAANGKIEDRYESAPRILEGEDNPPEGGDANVLIRTLGLTVDASQVDEALRGPPSLVAGVDADMSGYAQQSLGFMDKRLQDLPAQMRSVLQAQGVPEAAIEGMVKAQMAMMDTVRAQMEKVAAGTPLSQLKGLSNHVDAQDVAQALSKLLGLEQGQIEIGYRYAEAGDGPEGVELIR